MSVLFKRKQKDMISDLLYPLCFQYEKISFFFMKTFIKTTIKRKASSTETVPRTIVPSHPQYKLPQICGDPASPEIDQQLPPYFQDHDPPEAAGYPAASR